MDITTKWRRDLLRRHQIVIATGRRKRPSSTKITRCPFCPGNEADTEKPTLQWPSTAGPWTVRVIPNMYSFLHIEEGNGEKVIKTQVFRQRNGLGMNEIIVFTPRCVSFYEVSDEELFLGFWAARSRIISLREWRHKQGTSDSVLEQVHIFWNEGAAGRASLTHAHMQLAGTPVTLPVVQNIYQNAEQFWKETKEDSEGPGQCVFCVHAEEELGGDRSRLIGENGHFFATAEFAPQQPYECGIYPKSHLFSFEDCDEQQIKAFASLINQTIKQLGVAANRPGFNFSLINSPIQRHSLQPYFHWHARLHPRGISEPAGFEISTGSAVIEYLPEEVAAELRAAKI